MTDNPKTVLLFSGKRKSGKDYICNKLQSSLGENCEIIRISEPLKGLYAKNHDLDLAELLSDGPYKENYRQAMIKWSDEIRKTDPGYFCKAACDSAQSKLVWIVSDIRRKSDIKWFMDRYDPTQLVLIRVEADLDVRQRRGWVFTAGVDDVASESDLDDFEPWDLKISNNCNAELDSGLSLIKSKIHNYLSVL